MRIESLSLEGFRNIASLRLSPGPGANIIYGDNAQGKTNLLEAMWLFTGSRSFRGAKDGDYLPFGGGTAVLELGFFAEQREQSARIAFGADKKLVHLNEVKQERLSALSGVFCAVVFSPDHLSLVKEGPEKRRRMIDASLCQAYPKYGKILDHYERALRQRNRLLKDIPFHASLAETLDVWDTNLVEYGAYISHMRARYVARLSELSAEIYEGISLGKEALSLSYRPSFGGDAQGLGKDGYREKLAAAVKENRVGDIKLGSTSAGPHRDDIEIEVAGVSARSFGSQGQQRSCVLALKLAECRILEERCGEPPVVLLDDVMSELDEHRRGFLLNQLGGRQVMITCCDASSFSGLRDGRVFHIHGGALVGQE